MIDICINITELIILDAVFTYLCGQCIWNTLPCIVITGTSQLYFLLPSFLILSYIGCGYPPLSVRATVKQLVDQLKLPALGLFDYNVITSHGSTVLQYMYIF